MISLLTRIGKKVIPAPIFRFFQPWYHRFLAYAGALNYGFPSRKLLVVGVTGTKGKSTVTELAASIFRASGKKVAVLSTIHFVIGDEERPNLFKMTMPGRSFIQKFMREAVDAKCDVLVLEMTSEGAKQFRHRGIDLDCLIFTNLAHEHIESHGSYEKYREAKLSIARQLNKGASKKKVLVVNRDDNEALHFKDAVNKNVTVIPYGFDDAQEKPHDGALEFTWHGKRITSPLRGYFNIYNILAAATCAHHFGVSFEQIQKGVATLDRVPGRVEEVVCGQDFEVIVDYAHTPDSLIALYRSFEGKRIIGVLGNCGGGRDTWKRPEMGQIADEYCDEIILTNEDPYDEDPRSIVDAMVTAITETPHEIIMDRREAIAAAFKKAKAGDVVLITGKGTDPYIMGANGSKEEWSDKEVATEELKKIL